MILNKSQKLNPIKLYKFQKSNNKKLYNQIFSKQELNQSKKNLITQYLKFHRKNNLKNNLKYNKYNNQLPFLTNLNKEPIYSQMIIRILQFYLKILFRIKTMKLKIYL